MTPAPSKTQTPAAIPTPPLSTPVAAAVALVRPPRIPYLRSLYLPPRLLSLDAFRGFVLLLLASGGLGLADIARRYPGSLSWRTIAYHVDHVEWRGGGLWDLIQPAFMFMVGVSMAFSCASRRARGQPYAWMLLHALWRSVALVFLGIFLRSVSATMTQWTFLDVLSQIGLGYTFLFLLWNKPRWAQGAVAALILFAWWWLFLLQDSPAASFDFTSVGVPKNWPHHLTGFAAHWDKNTNAAAIFDRWLLNKFPRESPFVFNPGGYATLNFVPSLATMIFGLMVGELLRSRRPGEAKLIILALIADTLIALGWLFDYAGICPIVKRIWTPSWALYSAGWGILGLTLFFGLIDVLRFRAWTRPLVALGANSIAVYCMIVLLPGWILKTVSIHLGPQTIFILGDGRAPFVRAVLILVPIYVIAHWLHRHRAFVRI
jgi:heparan-alpha-glucosaminide N-acetyltransferase